MTTPRKPGRKFLPPALKRSRIIAVAYTEAEAERLERLAADHGDATAVYIRTAALARCDADEALRLPAR